MSSTSYITISSTRGQREMRCNSTALSFLLFAQDDMLTPAQLLATRLTTYMLI